MARPVLHKSNQRVGFIEQSQDFADNFQVCLLVSAADVINLARSSPFERHKDGAGMLVRKDPLAHVETIAIDGQWTVFHCVRDQNGNQLFGKLVGTVIVRAPGDNSWNSIRPVVREGKKSAAALLAEYGLLGSSGVSSRNAPVGPRLP